MRYINSWNSKLFDDNTGFSWGDASNKQWFSNGTGNVYFKDLTTTKYYASFYFSSSSDSYCSCYPFQMVFSDGSVINIKWDASTGFEFRINDVLKQKINGSFTYKQFHKVYIVADTQNGEVLFYVNGTLYYTYSDFITNGANLTSFRVRLSGWSNDEYCARMKNLIVTDEYLAINEEVMEVPTTVVIEGFTYDSSNGLYSTEQENSTITITPDWSTLSDFNVKSCNVIIEKTVLGDAIKNVQLDTDTYSNVKELPASGLGKYWQNVPITAQQFVVKTKK